MCSCYIKGIALSTFMGRKVCVNIKKKIFE